MRRINPQAVSVRCAPSLGVDVAYPHGRVPIRRQADRERALRVLEQVGWSYFARVWARRADAHRALRPKAGLEAERHALQDLARDSLLGPIAHVMLEARQW